MSKKWTDDELKALLASLLEAQKRTDAQLAETDAQLAKTDAQLAKTDAQLAKTDAQLARTDERLDAKFAEVLNMQKATAAQIAKTEAIVAETEAQIAKTSKEVGHLGSGRGEIAEEFFYQSLSKTPKIGGIYYDHVYRNWAHGIGGLSDEYDVILVNGEQLVLVEVKARASVSDINTLIKRKIPNFRHLFPHYANYKLQGAVASLTSSDTLIAKAKKAGVYFLTQQGDHVELMNQEARFF